MTFKNYIEIYKAKYHMHLKVQEALSFLKKLNRFFWEAA